MDEPQHPRTPAGDEAFARLRAADPAADARLDVDALRAEVARRAAGEEAPAEPAEVVPLAARRRTRWLQVAAVGVGAALVAGAGGYAVGASGDGGAGSGAAPAIALGGGAMPMSGAADSAESAATDMRIGPGFGARAEFTASGLPDDATTAHAWALDAAAVFSAETAARVASVLGVAGEPTLQYGSWVVGPQDGSAPSVSLQPDGSAGVSFFDPSRDPWSCTASAADTPDAGTADGAAEATPEMLDPSLVVPVDPSAPSCDPALGDGPGADAAVAQTRELLSSLGVDPGGFEYETTDTGTTRAASVLAYQVVDGQRTGLSWNVTLVADGVQSLYGSLAALVDLGEYPVVGAATAAARLNDPRFGSGWGGVMPLMRAEIADDAAVSPSADPTVPPTATPGDPIAWPVQQVTLTAARLGLTLLYQADGAAVLVPAYELTDADGATWSVIAVDEDSLDLAG